MIGSITKFSDNDEDNDFNVKISDIDTLEYDSTYIPASSPQVPILSPPPKNWYHPSPHNWRMSEIAKAVEDKRNLGS